jgi:hypothetical protein
MRIAPNGSKLSLDHDYILKAMVTWGSPILRNLHRVLTIKTMEISLINDG